MFYRAIVDLGRNTPKPVFFFFLLISAHSLGSVDFSMHLGTQVKMIKSFYRGNVEGGDKFLDCLVRRKLFLKFSTLHGHGNQVSCTGEQQCKHDEVEDQGL